MHHRFALAALTTLVLASAAPDARALDKQGSSHGGRVGGDSSGFGASGALTLGSAVYNPSYAARPDNSGHVLMRFAPHMDVDLIGSRLSIPIDMNVFTDRDQSGIAKLRPSEFDVISGLTTTWPLGRATALELGLRGERDMPVDQKGLVQSYADTRLKLLYSLSAMDPAVGRALAGGDVSGTFTLGWFTLNSSYAARPDNTGIALLRYGAHVELSAWHGHAALGMDVSSFTDKDASAARPSEVDLTPELVGRAGVFEAHVAYERDMPVDRSGLVQQLLLVHAVWTFNLTPPAEPPEVKEEKQNRDTLPLR